MHVNVALVRLRIKDLPPRLRLRFLASLEMTGGRALGITRCASHGDESDSANGSPQ